MHGRGLEPRQLLMGWVQALALGTRVGPRLVGTLGVTVGKRALHLVLPLYAAVMLAGAVLFAGQGMDAADVVREALGSFALRLTLLVGWSILTLPAARIVLAAPELLVLRALPIPTPLLVGTLVLLSSAVHVGFVGLWLRGGGWMVALEALVAVIAVESALLSSGRALGRALVFATALFGWWLAPHPLGGVVLTAAAVVGVGLAWRAAPAPGGDGWPLVVSFHAVAAAASAHVVSTQRAHPEAATRALAWALLAASGSALTLHNNVGYSSGWAAAVVVGVWAVGALIAAVTFARPLAVEASKLEWLLTTHGMSATGRRLAEVVAVGALLAFFGVVHGLVLRRAAMLPWSTFAIVVASGSLWGALVAATVRLTSSGSGRDAGRQLLVFAGLFGGVLAALAWGTWTMLGVLGLVTVVGVGWLLAGAREGEST